MTYANGLAPDSALAFVDGMHVAPMLAPRLNAFIAYSATQGRVLRVVRKYGGYRQRSPLAPEQEAVYAAGATGGSSVSVAKPGSSTHGDYNTGRVDLGNLSTGYTSAALAWIVANAGRFGLAREFGTADPNHFVASGSFAGGTVTPIDDTTTDPQHQLTQEEIDDMTASQSAAFIRNYQRDGQQGNAGGDFIVRALQYPRRHPRPPAQHAGRGRPQHRAHRHLRPAAHRRQGRRPARRRPAPDLRAAVRRAALRCSVAAQLTASNDTTLEQIEGALDDRCRPTRRAGAAPAQAHRQVTPSGPRRVLIPLTRRSRPQRRPRERDTNGTHRNRPRGRHVDLARAARAAAARQEQARTRRRG
jgi:hypothetical protein